MRYSWLNTVKLPEDKDIISLHHYRKLLLKMPRKQERITMNKYVLIVDDKAKNRERLSRIFQEIGWETREAETNTKALGLLSEVHFSLVVTDVLRRPKYHGESGNVGLELVEDINRRDENLPIVIVSSYSPENLKRMNPRLKVSGFFGKDLTDKELKKIFQRIEGRGFLGEGLTDEKRQEIFQKIIEEETFPKKLPSELYDPIVDFLTSLPTSISSSSSQQSFCYSAGLDGSLEQQLPFGVPAGQFMQHLVTKCMKYGTLPSGQHALIAVLKAAKNYVGKNRKEYCDTLIKAVKLFFKI